MDIEWTIKKLFDEGCHYNLHELITYLNLEGRDPKPSDLDVLVSIWEIFQTLSLDETNIEDVKILVYNGLPALLSFLCLQYEKYL